MIVMKMNTESVASLPLYSSLVGSSARMHTHMLAIHRKQLKFCQPGVLKLAVYSGPAAASRWKLKAGMMTMMANSGRNFLVEYTRIHTTAHRAIARTLAAATRHTPSSIPGSVLRATVSGAAQ